MERRRFSCWDLLRFNNVNLDPLTETYNMSFYLQYLAKWPQYCFNLDSPRCRPMGYILGKAESFASQRDSWHGHVTAVTVPPEYRRLGSAARLMDLLERVSEVDRAFLSTSSCGSRTTWRSTCTGVSATPCIAR